MPNRDRSSGPWWPVRIPGPGFASAWSAWARRLIAMAALWVSFSLAGGAHGQSDGGQGQGGQGLQPSERSVPLGDDDGESTAARDDVPKVSRPVAAVLAFFPGLMLGGSGHFALGHRQTAYRIFALQGVGVGLMAAGTVPLVATAASRYAVTPLAITAIAGVAVASTALMAELYGVFVPPDLRGRPALRLPQIEAEFGARYVYEPAFEYRSFLVNSLDLRWGGWRLNPSAWVALDDRNARLRALVSHRYFGPRAEP
ncbi:MAG: hypothetical protein DRI90_03875, partial [Deltaproteobacteria bacterium]